MFASQNSSGKSQLTWIDAGVIGKVAGPSEQAMLKALRNALILNTNGTYSKFFISVGAPAITSTELKELKGESSIAMRVLQLMSMLDSIPDYEMPDIIFRAVMALGRLPSFLI